MTKTILGVVLAFGLSSWITGAVAAPAAESPFSQATAIKQFLANTEAEYGSGDDSKTPEARLYGWAKAGAAYPELVSKMAASFKLAPVVAARLVPLILARGGSKGGHTSDPALIDRFIALSRAYPEDRLLLIEAERAIDGDSFSCEGDLGAYDRLLDGRKEADADRITLFDHSYCLPLLTERTTLEPKRFVPYLTLAERADESDDALLRLAFFRVADEKARRDPSVTSEVRSELRTRLVAENLMQGRIEAAVSLLGTDDVPARDGLLPWFDAETRKALAAAFLLVNRPNDSAIWRSASISPQQGVLPWWSENHVGSEMADPPTAAYEVQLLDRWNASSGNDGFDFYVQRYRLSNIESAGQYWDGVWSLVYDRLAIRDGYPGFVGHDEPDSAELAEIEVARQKAVKDCYRCAPDLIAAIKSIPAVPEVSQTEESAGAENLPASVIKQMYAEIAAPLPFWTEHALPAGLRSKPEPASGRSAASKPSALPPFLVPAEHAASHAKGPEWVSRLPAGTLVRYERRGQRIVAVTVSQSLDPTGELSAGGYWVSMSEDGGWHFGRPLYTGLRMFEPYVVSPRSKLPMLAGDRLQLEVKVRKLDDRHVMLPPIALALLAHRDNLYLSIPLADLARDSDNDGLTDIEEWAMLLNPNNPDTDGDHIPDGRDMLPQVPASNAPDRFAAPLAAVLQQLFGKSLGAIVTTSATADQSIRTAALGSGETDLHNGAGAIFLQAPAAYFRGIRLNHRVIVLDKRQIEALKRARGYFFWTSCPTFVVSHDGSQALVVWTNGWTGGTFLLSRHNGKWGIKPLSQWIT